MVDFTVVLILICIIGGIVFHGKQQMLLWILQSLHFGQNDLNVNEGL